MNKKSSNGPSLCPQILRDGGWYYEDRRGIEVYQETLATGANVVTSRTRIPFGRIIKSLERCGYVVTKRDDA